MRITVSPVLQQNATPEEREAHIDIADWLIHYLVNPPAPDTDVRQHSRTFLTVARYFSPEHQEEVEALINALGLDFLGAERKD